MDPVVATGGNRWKIGSAQTRPKQAKTVAVGCDRLPIEVHGKEGVDGSSPSEGFRKFLLISSFRCRRERQERAAASTERPRAGEFFDDTTSNRCC